MHRFARSDMLRTVALAAAVVSLTACGSLERRVASRFLVPRAEQVATPADLGLPYEDVEIETGADTSVHGWFVPALRGDGRTVLLCHGNAANISFYHPYYAFLHAAGWNVLLHDYRGYGRSRGAVDVAALFDDTEVMLDHVLARADVDPHKVVVFGASLGSIVALRVAARRPEVAAVVAESASSPHDALARALGGFPAWLVEALALPGGMEPDANAARLTCPALFLCGERDVALREHLRAFRAAAGPAVCWVLPRAGHAPHPLLAQDGEYQDQIVTFLDAVAEGRVPRIEARVADLHDGMLDVHLTRRGLPAARPLPVELCVIDAQGGVAFVDRWMRAAEETWRVSVAAEPENVAAVVYRRAAPGAGDDDWLPAPGPLAAAEEILTTLSSAAEIANTSDEPLPAAHAFLQTLAWFEDLHAFAPLLETELIPSYVAVGRLLAASSVASDRSAAVTLLRRALAAEPANPRLHYWPVTSYRTGFPFAAELDDARRLLATLGA